MLSGKDMEVIRQLVISNPVCADVAAELRKDGVLHMVEPDDLAEMAVMRDGAAVIDLGQMISMGRWHMDEKFMSFLFQNGMEW